MSLRWRIALSFGLATAAVLAAVGMYTRAALLRHTTETIRGRLLAEARMAAALAPAGAWDDLGALGRWAEQMDSELGARVTLVDGDGTVVADSRKDPAGMESHLDRPELLAARRTGVGSAIRYSESLESEMLYAAAATGDGQNGRTVRLAVPLTAVWAASKEVRWGLGILLLVAALAFVIFSQWLARSLTASVQRIVEVARRVGRGDLDARITDAPPGELGELAQVVNSAVERLAELLNVSQAEARRYAAILDQMSDAAVILDAAGRVELVNAEFARLFGVAHDEIEGRPLEQIALNYDVSRLLARAREQGTTQRDEVRLLHPKERTLLGVATPLTGQEEQIVGAVGLLHDVTDLYRMDQVRRDFVANASHELRSPAAGIRALAEALEGGALADPERGPEFVREIVAASERLTAILDDMLTLTRVERAQELLRPEWLAVDDAVDQALLHVVQAAEAKEVTLETSVPPGDRAYADPGSLQTVLTNLLDNGVKYTPAGGRVAVRGRRVPDGYEISVQDTGVGVPEADRERIFERFYRVDKARDRATGGTGLGLAIVKHTVEAHGGSVGVRSRPGEGSVFTVFLPSPPAAA